MRIGIVGGGLMGSGIAEVSARSGVDVTVVEVSDESAARSRERVRRSMERAVSRDHLSPEERTRAEQRLAFTDRLSEIEGVDAAIEAIVESEAAKRNLFAELDRTLPQARFLASNTSSVPIMKLAAATRRPERVLGLHFFNPVPQMPLVEVVRSIMTADEVLQEAIRFATDLGKTCIDAEDRAGFIVNSLLVPYILSAIRMYESGFASREDIDQGMVLGCNHPMGPLALADLIGLDTLQAVALSLHEEFRDQATVGPPLLSRMVEAGLLGRKAGRGFYEYGD